jgi:ATP-dependent DNA helicase RecQ
MLGSVNPVTSLPLDSLLSQHFRLPAFRRGQREIVDSILRGKDALAVLPTGGGKSLCYQMVAVATGKLVVVISPLIALMKDQVASLGRLGVPAGALHSGQSEEEKRDVFRRAQAGGPFLLYLSPERVQKEGFRRWIQSRPIALFAIDEAHCISQWGHDFREEYGQLKLLKEMRPDVPILALTASATPAVLSDIVRRLQQQAPERHVHGFYRPNLYYQVEARGDEDDKLRFLESALRQVPEGRVIIYCGTRRATEEVAARLSRSFTGVGFYHAGLSAQDRSLTQNAYGEGQMRILVATNAFGMGIDHPDVRLVAHFHMPANIDSLYQEMGRAGRDGKESTCLMLYSKKDKGLQSYFITQSDAPADIKRARWNTLEALVSYAEGGECRHAEILTYYHDSQRIERCGHCDTCAPESTRRIRGPSKTEEAAAASARKKSRSRSSDKRGSGGGSDEVLGAVEQERFQALKEWRRLKAKELDVAAFLVFSDRTLRQLATEKPASRDQLLQVYGIGSSKVDAFGTDLLAELAGLP